MNRTTISVQERWWNRRGTSTPVVVSVRVGKFSVDSLRYIIKYMVCETRERPVSPPLPPPGRAPNETHSSFELFRLQLPACYGRQPVIRGSDDFYPRDKASHSPHIYANAFNGLMISSCGLQVGVHQFYTSVYLYCSGVAFTPSTKVMTF